MTLNMKKPMKAMNSILANGICWFISLVSLFPIVWLLYSSLKSNEEFLMDTLALPKKIIFSNYPRAFEIGNLWTAIMNSSIYVAVNVVLVCISAFIVAYFVTRYRFKGKKFIYYTFMLGMLIPLYALLVPVFVQYRVLNLLNTRLSLILTYFAMEMPLAIFLYESFIGGIPCEIDEAATVDGCTLMQRMMLIIFPLCRPIMATVAIITLLHTWNEFAFAVILTPQTELRTIAVALRSYSAGAKVEYAFLMAGLFAASLPVLLAYFFFSKQVVKGMTAGAVKG